MSDIFYAKVISMTEDKTAYNVVRLGGPVLTSGQQMELAVPLSPIPTNSGAGMTNEPTNFNSLFAVCMKTSMDTCFLVGFVPKPAGMPGADKKEKVVLGAGGTGLVGPAGVGFRIYGDGSVSAVAENWAQWVMEPVSQSIFETYRHQVTKWWTGSQTYHGVEDEGTYELYIAKKIDKSVIYPGTSAPPDNFRWQVGTLETDGVARWELQADANIAKIFDFKSSCELGDVPGKLAIHYEQERVTTSAKASADVDIDGGFTYTVEGPQVKTVVSVNSELGNRASDGQVYINSKGSSSSVEVKCDVTGSDIVSINVGEGKALVTIDKEGNVIFKLADSAKLYLGGKAAAQELLTVAFAKQIFDTHGHTSAVGPTGPPIIMFKSLPPAAADALTNFTTFSTKAE